MQSSVVCQSLSGFSFRFTTLGLSGKPFPAFEWLDMISYCCLLSRPCNWKKTATVLKYCITFYLEWLHLNAPNSLFKKTEQRKFVNKAHISFQFLLNDLELTADVTPWVCSRAVDSAWVQSSFICAVCLWHPCCHSISLLQHWRRIDDRVLYCSP